MGSFTPAGTFTSDVTFTAFPFPLILFSWSISLTNLCLCQSHQFRCRRWRYGWLVVQVRRHVRNLHAHERLLQLFAQPPQRLAHCAARALVAVATVRVARSHEPGAFTSLDDLKRRNASCLARQRISSAGTVL